LAPPLRFFADESVLGLGLALARLRPDTVHPGHPLLPDVPRGALDSEWIPAIAARGLIAIGRDKRIRTRPAERQAIIDSGLRYIWIGGKQDQSSWEWMRRLARYWDDIERLVEELGAGPWFLTVNLTSVVVSYHPDRVAGGVAGGSPEKGTERGGR
jgi:hypothetical protein